MYKKFSALNTDWNRKLDFLNESSYGVFLFEKNGMIHFAWHFSKHTNKYYKCEEPIFTKNFRDENEEVKFAFDEQEHRAFENYPF